MSPSTDKNGGFKNFSLQWHGMTYSEDNDSRRCAIAQVMQDEVCSSVNHSTVPLFEGV